MKNPKEKASLFFLTGTLKASKVLNNNIRGYYITIIKLYSIECQKFRNINIKINNDTIKNYIDFKNEVYEYFGKLKNYDRKEIKNEISKDYHKTQYNFMLKKIEMSIL